MRWLHLLMGEERGMDALDLAGIDASTLSGEEGVLVGMMGSCAGMTISESTTGMPMQMVAARIERFFGQMRLWKGESRC